MICVKKRLKPVSFDRSSSQNLYHVYCGGTVFTSIRISSIFIAINYSLVKISVFVHKRYIPTVNIGSDRKNVRTST